MNGIIKFRHVALITLDLDKTLKFYTEVIGFKVARQFEIGSPEFQKGVGIPGAKARAAQLSIPGSDAELEIFEYEKKGEYDPKVSSPDRPGFRHIALQGADIEDCCAHLRKNGVEFFSEPITISGPPNVAGNKFVYFKDPEGNILELSQLPKRA